MVAHLMGDDVGPGRLARGAEAVGELLPEGEVQVDLAVLRAIERPHRRMAEAAAGGRDLVVEPPGGGRAVGAPDLIEVRPPDLVLRRLDHIDEAAGLGARRAAHALRGLRVTARTRACALQDVQRRLRADAKNEIADGRQHHAANANTADADRTEAAAVLD